MFTQAISPPLLTLIERLNSIPEMASSYLGGGTALALQLGHRRSEDLDFFFPKRLETASYLVALQREVTDIVVLNQTPAHIEILIQGTKLDLIRERISPRFAFIPVYPQTLDLKMADARDIGRMKLLAIGSRGSKKDFVDLFCLTRDVVTLESLIATVEGEHKEVKYSRLLFLKGLLDFEEADQEPDPMMIWEWSWDEIKQGLRDEVRLIARKLQAG
ncbi:MAG: nucleotidyl transferase AbiEii/AbiGii toxin family protein [Thermodesulfobacteriota bacterium]